MNLRVNLQDLKLIKQMVSIWCKFVILPDCINITLSCVIFYNCGVRFRGIN